MHAAIICSDTAGPSDGTFARSIIRDLAVFHTEIQANELMILFGIRSPIVVEYEETCRRLGLAISMAVSVNGTPRILARDRIVELADVGSKNVEDGFLACAFTPSRRAQLIAMGREAGLTLAQALIDPTAVIATSVRVGDGTFINAGVVIGAVSIIGQGVLINRAASIGHHSVLQDHVSVGPGATLAGNIHVGAGAMIGAGAVIQPDIRIGARAIVAAGSVVRRHVAENTLVAGNPATRRPFNAARSSLHMEDGE